MRFIVDAQLPPALARMLVSRGHDAEHVADIGFKEAEDPQIWNYAIQLDAVIITKDEDFVILGMVRTDGPAIVWIHVGNTRKKAFWNIQVPE